MKNLELKIEIIRKYGQQAVFSQLTGLREERLSRLIHGRAKPTEDERQLIAAKLGAEPGEIFSS